MAAVAGKRVEVPEEDRAELERIVRAVSSEVRMVDRARIALCAAEGLTADEISARRLLEADGGQVAGTLRAPRAQGSCRRASLGPGRSPTRPARRAHPRIRLGGVA
jgi:hypothetical protein